MDASENTPTDDVVRKFCEETVLRAVELAASTTFSAQELLEEAKLMMPPVVARVKRRGRVVTAWDMAKAEVFRTADKGLLAPTVVPGVNNGRPSFDGSYMKDVQALYWDPEKKLEFERLAKLENQKSEEVSIEKLSLVQKKLLKALQKLVRHSTLPYADSVCRTDIMIFPVYRGIRARNSCCSNGCSINESEWGHRQDWWLW
jgi:hypothetical protein